MSQPYLTIADAAKAVHLRKAFVRRRILDSGIGIVMGGTKEHPRIKVKLDELQQVLESHRLVGQKQKRVVKLDPGVTC